MASRIGVIEGGRLLQIGTPSVTENPVNAQCSAAWAAGDQPVAGRSVAGTGTAKPSVHVPSA